MNKRKGLPVMLVSLLLLTLPTNAMAEAVPLEKNKAAPFAGVLVPDDMFREMSQDVIAKSDFERELESCEGKLSFSTSSSASQATWFVAGAALGAVLIAVAK
jgi:hypothetical protein